MAACCLLLAAACCCLLLAAAGLGGVVDSDTTVVQFRGQQTTNVARYSSVTPQQTRLLAAAVTISIVTTARETLGLAAGTQDLPMSSAQYSSLRTQQGRSARFLATTGRCWSSRRRRYASGAGTASGTTGRATSLRATHPSRRRESPNCE